MAEHRDGQSIDPGLTRPVPRPAAVLVLTLCAAAVLALLRGRHGSWTTVGTALIAPGLFSIGALAVWWLERTRGRPLPRRLVVPVFLLGGGAAGGIAAVLAPTLGPVGPRVLTGCVWGGLIGLVWVRSRSAV
jgi:peptidoglycan/LPS O-acetylase OafA/YrhL